MHEDRLLDLFERMVKIESPSWHEADMARFCADELEALGFDVEFDDSAAVTGSDTGNLLACRPGSTSGAVAFSAHMDTVKPCEGISVTRIEDERGDILCSEGATILSADDKAGIAAIFEGIRSAIEQGSDLPDIYVILTTCEEQSLLGSSSFGLADKVAGMDCFVLDADGAPGSVICQAPCHHTMDVRIHGKAAHAGVEPEVGVSAIEVAADAISGMQLGRLDDATTANVGVIEGGVATNIVAESCAFQAECRSVFPDRAEAQKEQMTQAVLAACERAGATADIEWKMDYPEVDCPEESPLIVRARRAIEACGLGFSAVRTGGGADANCLRGMGVNAITLGTGMTNFHSTDEYIKVQDLMDDARLVQALISEYAS
ncbi:MAG: M20/M25/M40 family metallo-hydrolase [Eggerthellaceae bacterium]|nr:M20/M25/M40 family metallo-hydrolase [Eggerthellaceae bacterium]